MTRARDIANLVDANGDIVAGALDNVPASNDASALTTGTLDVARLPTEIVSSDTTPQLGGDLSTSGNDINFGDNDKAIFGAGSDLQIYSDGNNAIISEVSASGSLILQGSNTRIKTGTGSETLADFLANGAVNLYYDNSKKFETTATGVDVTGTVAADSITLGTQVLSVASNGNLVGDDNLQGFTYHPVNRTSVLSQVAQFSITAETTGNFDVVNTYGYPSGVKAIYCTVWVQQDGFTSSNGADHSSYHFGQDTPDGAYASSGNISTAFDSPFSFAHDGEGASTGDHGEYGLYSNGLIPVNSNGRIYYRLGHGYSGGTHYISLIMNGYII